MKKLILLLAIVFSFQIASRATSNPSTNSSTQTVHSIEVFYFHYSRRCATCNAVEEVTKATLQEYFDNKVSFESLNLDEKLNKKKAHQLKVSGQTLLICKGTQKINITNEAFMNARTNPDKLKQIIKEKIESLQ